MDSETIGQFGASLRGALVGRDAADYDEVRKLYNGMIDKRPLLIARCVDVADVVAAVNFARENGLLLAVRGGGHNGPGLGSCDDGLVIDLSPMKGVRVDPATRTVRVGPGCTSGDVDHATHAFGLAVPFGIVSSTGVGGLTLGGGIGYLCAQARADHRQPLEADVVLADGSFVTASKEENPELFWALRGGGGNFGVVTSFLFRAHPVKMVYAGPIFWDAKDAVAGHARLSRVPARGAGGARVVRRPEDGALDGSVPAEHWGKRACAVISCFNGSAEDGEKAMAPLLEPGAAADLQLDGRDAVPGDAEPVRRLLPAGAAVVLEGRFREVAAGRGDRDAYRRGGEGAERAVADASLSDQRGRASRRQGTRRRGARATPPGRW